MHVTLARKFWKTLKSIFRDKLTEKLVCKGVLYLCHKAFCISLSVAEMKFASKDGRGTEATRCLYANCASCTVSVQMVAKDSWKGAVDDFEGSKGFLFF